MAESDLLSGYVAITDKAKAVVAEVINCAQGYEKKLKFRFTERNRSEQKEFEEAVTLRGTPWGSLVFNPSRAHHFSTPANFPLPCYKMAINN